MTASVTSINARRMGTYVLLEAHLPGRPARPIGVYLFDPASGRLWLRMRASYDDLADPDDIEVLQALDEDIRARAAESGAAAYLESLEDSLSGVLRVSERQTVEVDAFSRVADRLFDGHVEKIGVEPFRTHVPLYSLRAAAGGLGEEMESAAEDWVRVPEGMRLDPGVFVAHVVGRSMEPRIPDGSLNLFRFHPVGSRQNKILLIQRFGATDDSARYTVKKYTSTKIATGEDEWRHDRIRLEPLNPEFEAWDVEPEDFAVVAEWLRVLE
ncbi:MAG TPA: S24 family peptidase [Bryobacteraceae bacterium]|nr:S24 family peptidase [Bryobacteraceae bacterium]